MGLLRDATWAALERSLDGAALRQRTIAQNMANVDTPGYKRSVVHFEDALESALQSSGTPDDRARRIAAAEPDVERVEAPLRADGNNVDIDLESSLLSENTLQYEGVSRMLSARIRLLRTSIMEGRR